MNNTIDQKTKRYKHSSFNEMPYDEQNREIHLQIKRYKQDFQRPQIALIAHRIYELSRAIHFSKTKEQSSINQAKLGKLIIDAQIAFNHLEQIIKEPTP